MSDQEIDFTRLYDRMKQARLEESDRPVIWGGEFPADRLSDFLTKWQAIWSTMPYRIWEYVNRIEFADQPAQQDVLLRAEIFGEGGHLALRRDAGRWLWRYIGTPVNLRLSDFGGVDFWQTHPTCQLRRYAESVILWGNRKDGQPRWSDDRVAAAILNYPLNGQGRVHLHFWRYTENGQTVFVWYRSLSNQPVGEL